MKQLILIILIASSMNITFAQYGTLDNTFGEGGIAVSENFGRCNVVAVQADQKIIAAGLGTVGEDSGFVLARYLPDGTPDSNFGKGGRVVTEFSDKPNPYLTSVAILLDNRIVAAGFVQRKQYYGDDALLVCYLPDGSIDSSFGSNGIVTLHIYDKKYDNNAFTDIAVQPDGRIVAAGTAADNTDFENSVFYNLVARYLPNGTLDKSFGNEGATVTPAKNIPLVHALALQPDGKIVIAGSGVSYNLIYAARYNNSGTVDTSFGKEGSVVFSYDNNPVSIYDMALQKNGKIVLGHLQF